MFVSAGDHNNICNLRMRGGVSYKLSTRKSAKSSVFKHSLSCRTVCDYTRYDSRQNPPERTLGASKTASGTFDPGTVVGHSVYEYRRNGLISPASTGIITPFRKGNPFDVRYSRKIFTTVVMCVATVLTVGCSESERSLTIAFSNNMVGEIRSCGCAARDFGGLGRRATFLNLERLGTDNFLLLEGGDFFGTNLNYGEEKASLTLQSMSFMGYDGMVLGEKDLTFGLDYIVEKSRSLRLPIVIANVYYKDSGERVFPASRIVTLSNGLHIGLVGVMGDRLKLQRDADRIRIDPPTEAALAEIEQIKKDTDMIIVLANMGTSELRALAKSLPDVELVVSGHEGRPMRKLKRFGTAYILQSPGRGQYMGVAYASVDPKGKITQISSALKPLTTNYKDHDAIVKLFSMYDLAIADKERHLLSVDALTSSERSRDRYGGSEACKPCHEPIFDQWATTKHAHAFDVLTSQKREYDRDCTPCHTTGFYELGGFSSIDETPDLVHVGCESCHGNGHKHVKDPTVKMPGKSNTVCVSCHTQEQTPDFAFDTHWDPIRH